VKEDKKRERKKSPDKRRSGKKRKRSERRGYADEKKQRRKGERLGKEIRKTVKPIRKYLGAKRLWGGQEGKVGKGVPKWEGFKTKKYLLGISVFLNKNYQEEKLRKAMGSRKRRGT